MELMFDDLRSRLADRRITLLVLDETARRFIAQQGFDPVYGARPLRRFIAHEVETKIARALLEGNVRRWGADAHRAARRRSGSDLRGPPAGRGGDSPGADQP